MCFCEDHLYFMGITYYILKLFQNFINLPEVMSFFTNFIATFSPENLCYAKTTLPNPPSPNGLIVSNSAITLS